MSLLDLCLVFAVILLAVRSQIQAEVIRDFEAYMLRMDRWRPSRWSRW